MTNESDAVGQDKRSEPETAKATAEKPRKLVPVVVAIGVAALGAAGYYLYKRSVAKTNDVALDAEPKPVTVVEGRPTKFRASRRYVARIDPWLSAKVGPQLVSAYVDTVLFRPGGVVKVGDVLATLDCRNASAESQSVAMAAKALEAKQAALAKEAARINALLDGGFVSQNEADKKAAEATSQQADILAAKAKLLGSSLEVNDCVLKAPFAGEVSDRYMDPGAFARPGVPILALVDRNTVRVSADVPEIDFGLVAPGAPVRLKILSTGKALTAPISRRSPNADPATRTVHFEIDLADPERAIPVGTTAELSVDYGEPIEAAELPLTAASIRGDKATLFVLEGDRVKKRTVAVLGESGGSLYVDAALKGAKIVTEGRGLLSDNDKVKAAVVEFVPTVTSAPPPAASSNVKPEGTL